MAIKKKPIAPVTAPTTETLKADGLCLIVTPVQGMPYAIVGENIDKVLKSLEAQLQRDMDKTNADIKKWKGYKAVWDAKKK